MPYINADPVPIIVPVKYHNPDLLPIERIDKGDWIDLRAAKSMSITKGQMVMVPLGISMKIPEGYEAILAPRSSLFKNHGTLMANSIGIIDNSYCGDNDQWMACLYGTRDTQIELNERICQFRFLPTMRQIEGERNLRYIFDAVDTLGCPDRGGYGSTGRQ